MRGFIFPITYSRRLLEIRETTSPSNSKACLTHSEKLCTLGASSWYKTVKDSSNIDEDSKQDKNHWFIFKVGIDTHNVECLNGLLVDCGATTYVVHDINKLIRFDEHFNPEHHYIELA